MQPLLEQPPSGPPVTSNGPPVSNIVESTTAHQTHSEATVLVQTSPQVPPEGLPHGWTIEQWHHYGHQYINTEK